jgi:hypothetical protein
MKTATRSGCDLTHYTIRICWEYIYIYIYIYMTQVYTCYRNTVFILTFLTSSLHNMFWPPGPSSIESQTLSFYISRRIKSVGNLHTASFHALTFQPVSRICSTTAQLTCNISVHEHLQKLSVFLFCGTAVCCFHNRSEE